MLGDPVREFQAALAVLQRRVSADADQWWARIQAALPEDQAVLLKSAFQEFSLGHGTLAEHLGMSFVSAYRAAVNDSSAPPPVGSSAPGPRLVNRLVGEVQVLLDGRASEPAYRAFQREVESAVIGRARHAVENSARAAGRRWARIPNLGACDFCLTLATRGAVYSSREKAGGDGNRYHAHCRCVPIEVGGGRASSFYDLVVDERARWKERQQRLGTERKPSEFVVELDVALLEAAGLPPVPTREDWHVNLRGGMGVRGRPIGGHAFGAGIPWKTEAPSWWREADWVDAYAAAITTPDAAGVVGDRRIYVKDFHGVVVEAAFYPEGGVGRFVHVVPRCGDGVAQNVINPGGKLERVPVPYTVDALAVNWRGGSRR